jgi:hypothetical protein
MKALMVAEGMVKLLVDQLPLSQSALASSSAALREGPK